MGQTILIGTLVCILVAAGIGSLERWDGRSLLIRIWVFGPPVIITVIVSNDIGWLWLPFSLIVTCAPWMMLASLGYLVADRIRYPNKRPDGDAPPRS